MLFSKFFNKNQSLADIVNVHTYDYLKMESAMSNMNFSVCNNLFSNIYKNEGIRGAVCSEEVAGEFEKFEKGEITKSEMSLRTYEEYVYETVSSFEITPKQKYIKYKINFSDEVLQKMKSDKRFEEKIFGTVKSYFGNEDLTAKGTIHLKFLSDGECQATFERAVEKTKEEKRREGENFWTARARRQKEIDKIVFERNRKKRIREKQIRNDMIDRKNMQNYIYAIRRARAKSLIDGKPAPVDFYPMMKEPMSLEELLAGLS